MSDIDTAVVDSLTCLTPDGRLEKRTLGSNIGTRSATGVLTPRTKRRQALRFKRGQRGPLAMDKRTALAALVALSLGCCSRHEHLAPVNYSPPPSSEPSEEVIRTTIVQQSITSYQGPCPYSGPSCQGRSAYEKPTGQPVYCYTKDIPPETVSSYRGSLTSRPSNDETRGGPLSITAPAHP